MRNSTIVGPSVVAMCLVFSAVVAAQTEDWQDQLRADWLAQVAAHHGLTTQQDAAGGCDGIKDGAWGFHTDQEADPWWQVDFGASHGLSRVVLYNRCDGALAARASRLILLVSDDGEQWRQVYQHNGEAFWGVSGGPPLEVALDGIEARFLRIQLPGVVYFHLDEVEVYGAEDPARNIALGQPADQSSLSQWSTESVPVDAEDETISLEAVRDAIERGLRLAERLAAEGVTVAPAAERLREIAGEVDGQPTDIEGLYIRTRTITRELLLASPQLDFDSLLFAKRAPGVYSHMSDQYYGWWSRPGGGVFILDGLKGSAPRVRCLTAGMEPGSFLQPELSHDGTRILFAYCRYYDGIASLPDKADRAAIPEDAFYHIFEMGLDGTGLRQLTTGRYNDFDARYLPNGDIVFISSRRGQFVQYDLASAMSTLEALLPDSFVRCGGGASRPVAVFTLHSMSRDGQQLRPISAFENFEWTPSVSADGRVLYARWDYVDRHNGPYMSLWSTSPDGTASRIVYGNFTQSPQAIFEARSIPGSTKLMCIASAHHSITAGSVMLLDPAQNVDGAESITRLTPEVCFPETEGWPETYFADPYPLSESLYLAAWSNEPLLPEGNTNPPNAMGLYLCDDLGNLELIHRDPDISSMYPIPLRSRPVEPVLPDLSAADQSGVGTFLLTDVYQGLTGVERGTVTDLRIVGVPPKVQPEMNSPNLGITAEDPGKVVLGTVPVESDGSAYFSVPSGLSVLFQALDEGGMALQTMRSVTYVQPGETQACIGCHEPRSASPSNAPALAASRPPSKLRLGPNGSWPLRFDALVQPVLDTHCVSCHSPSGDDALASALDLTPAAAYETIVGYGQPTLRDQIKERYMAGSSPPGVGAARESEFLALLGGEHHGVTLGADDRERLITWLDTYAQRLGSFSDDQEERLRAMRRNIGAIIQDDGE